MPKTPAYSDIAAGYGARLLAARKAVAPSAAALAREVGVTKGRWSHWENERYPPDIHVLLALKMRHGISLDWIFAGDPSGLRLDLAQRIVQVASNRDEPPAVQALVNLFGQSNLAREGAGGLHESRSPFRV